MARGPPRPARAGVRRRRDARTPARRAGAARRRRGLLHAVLLGIGRLREIDRVRRALPGHRRRARRSRAPRERALLSRARVCLVGPPPRGARALRAHLRLLAGRETERFGLSGLPYSGSCAYDAWAALELGHGGEALELLDRGARVADAPGTSTARP